jgi:hypothetical protein
MVRSLPFRGMICAWSICKKIPNGEPQRNKFDVLLRLRILTQLDEPMRLYAKGSQDELGLGFVHDLFRQVFDGWHPGRLVRKDVRCQSGAKL